MTTVDGLRPDGSDAPVAPSDAAPVAPSDAAPVAPRPANVVPGKLIALAKAVVAAAGHAPVIPRGLMTSYNGYRNCGLTKRQRWDLIRGAIPDPDAVTGLRYQELQASQKAREELGLEPDLNVRGFLGGSRRPI